MSRATHGGMSGGSSSTSSSDAALLASLRELLLSHCEPPRAHVPLEQQSQELMRSGRVLWTQELDCMALLAQSPALGERLFTDTRGFMDLVRGECAVLCLEAGRTVSPADISLRLTHLPTVSSVPPSLPPATGTLVQVCGSIVRMTAKRVVPFAYRRMCPRCRAVDEAHSNPFDRAEQVTGRCTMAGCKKEELQIVGQVWMDYAECRLQQRSNHSGKLPRSILVTLDDELSSKCTVGQFVEVIGMLYPKWKRVFPLSRPAIEPAIWAINVLPMESYRGAALMSGASGQAARRRPGRQADKPKFSPDGFYLSFSGNKRRRGVALVKSVCPQLAGLFGPRMAILLASLGGASTTGKSAMHIRSTIHCLLVGDPSTGKSQLLRFAAAVAPRSTSTTGMGSTSAGLTVAATKDQGEWVLEPGALVLSDGGACIIDELRTVSVGDRASLHEAMEQQTISVAKGGLVTKLRTACSVIAACNPPPTKRAGRTEVGVGGPLLSRFDFIFLLWDTPQPAVDTRIAEHVLSCNVASHQPDPPLGIEEAARFLWWLRRQYATVDGPLLSDDAADLLAAYYEIQRQRGATPALDDAVPVTVRLLEALVRITQAHAKLHLQSLCTIDDAAMAVLLMERTAHSLKCPLPALGPNVYSSSRELDEVFLCDSDEALADQDAVLSALVDVIRNYHSSPFRGSSRIGGDRGVTRDSAHGGEFALDDDEGEDVLLNAVRCTNACADAPDVASAAAPAASFLGFLVPPAPAVGVAIPRESRSTSCAAAAQLAREISMPQDAPRSLVQYAPGTFERQWITPHALLASQRAPPKIRAPSVAPMTHTQHTAMSQPTLTGALLPDTAFASPALTPMPVSAPPVPVADKTEIDVYAPSGAADVQQVEGVEDDEDELELFASSPDHDATTLPVSQPSQGSLPTASLLSLASKRKRSADDIMKSLRFRF